jgi:large subunit ribosomal protein L22
MDNLVTVTLRDQKISPKKARLVINFVRGMKVEEAQNALGRLDNKGARDIANLLKNAIDAAKNKDYKAEDLFISESICQEGRKLKRSMVKARGRSTQFQKRMSHLKISLSKNKEIYDDKKSSNKNNGKQMTDKKQDRILKNTIRLKRTNNGS